MTRRAPGRDAAQGGGRVSDLAELGPQLPGAGPALVMGDADALGPGIHGDLLDAWLAGQVALDVRLARVAGNAGRGQLDRGRAHLLAPFPAGTCAADVTEPNRSDAPTQPTSLSRQYLRKLRITYETSNS